MVGGGEKYRQQAICESYLSQERYLQVLECVLPLKSLTHLSLSQSISLSLLESSTSDLKCVAEKKSSGMYSICSSGGGGPESGFH